MGMKEIHKLPNSFDGKVELLRSQYIGKFDPETDIDHLELPNDDSPGAYFKGTVGSGSFYVVPITPHNNSDTEDEKSYMLDFLPGHDYCGGINPPSLFLDKIHKAN